MISVKLGDLALRRAVDRTGQYLVSVFFKVVSFKKTISNE